MAELKDIQFFGVTSLSTALVPNSVYFVLTPNTTSFKLYVTDLNGIPVPIADNTTTGSVLSVTGTGVTGTTTNPKVDISTFVSSQLNNQVYLSLNDGKLQVNPVTSPNNSLEVNSTNTELQIQLSAAIQSQINSALQSGANISELTNDVGYLTIGDLNGTDLSYTPSTTSGTVNSSTGTDAVIPLAGALNAGLLSPNEKSEIASAVQPSDLSTVATTGEYSDLINIPSEFPPSAHTHPISEIINLQSDLDSKINTTDKGVINGVASLDGNGKVPLLQMNDALLGNVKWKGLYNGIIITSSPDSTLVGTALPTPSITNEGWYFISESNYTYSGKDYETGDWIISNGTIWDKVDNTDSVSSVFGRTGNITAQSGDYNTGLVTETTDKNYQSDLQKLYNDATSSIQTQLNSKESITNKATDFTTVNNTLYPTVQAVKSQLDLKSNDSSVIHNNMVSETKQGSLTSNTGFISGTFSSLASVSLQSNTNTSLFLRQGARTPFQIFGNLGNIKINPNGTGSDLVNNGYALEVVGTVRATSTFTLGTSPTESLGTYEFLTRNTVSGADLGKVEKLSLANVQSIVVTSSAIDIAKPNIALTTSPILTGTPEAPTPTTPNGVATKSFVESSISSAVNLQSAYNSSPPKITTTTALGAVTIQRGSASDTDRVFQIYNGSGGDTGTYFNGLGHLYLPNLNASNVYTNRVQLNDNSLIANGGATSGNIIKTTSTGWESGIKIDYQSDLSATYTNRSLVDKAYVDSKKNEAGQVKVNYTGLSTINFVADTIKTLDINAATPTVVSSPTTTYPKNTPNNYGGFFASGRGTSPTGRLIENPINGQVHIWRVQIGYSNKASGSNGALDVILSNPISGFQYVMPFTLPSGRTSGTLNLNAITIADGASIPSPNGYILQAVTSFTDANLTLEILSITRISQAVEII